MIRRKRRASSMARRSCNSSVVNDDDGRADENPAGEEDPLSSAAAAAAATNMASLATNVGVKRARARSSARSRSLLSRDKEEDEVEVDHCNDGDKSSSSSSSSNSNSRGLACLAQQNESTTTTTTSNSSNTASSSSTARSNLFGECKEESSSSARRLQVLGSSSSSSSSSSILAPATQFPSNSSNSNNNNNNSTSTSRMMPNGNKAAAAATGSSSSSSSSYSLFGAVMSSVGTGTSTTCTGINSTASAASRTSATTASEHEHEHEPHPSTPAKQPPKGPYINHNNNHNNNNGMLSPGGFQLQDFVNGFGNSPFCFTKQQTNNNSNNNSNHASSNFSNASSPSQMSLDSTPRRTLEWHECTIDCTSTHRFLHLVDWSIQSALQLECTPAAAMLQNVDATVQQQALRQFVSNQQQQQHMGQQLQQLGSKDRARAAAVYWEASLLYWQHPATHPLPPHLFRRSSTSKTKSKSKLAEATSKGRGKKQQQQQQHLLAEKNHSSLSNHGNSRVAFGASASSSSSMPAPPIRKPAAPQLQQQPQHQQAFAVVGDSANNRRAKNGEATSNGNFLAARGREWREAFRSLYLTWMEQIRQLNSNSKSQEPIVALVSNLYFYASARGHTVLFRVGVDRCQNDRPESDSSSPEAARFVPEIVLSASTLDLRDQLRSMGVQLMLLDSWHGIKGGAVFVEEDLVRSMQSLGGVATSSKRNRQEQDDGGNSAAVSPNIQAELVALRRAQAFGQNVGADVSVQVHPRGSNNTLPSRSPKRIPPLYMTGVDDCAAFFEVYYNTFGNIGTGQVGDYSNSTTMTGAHELSHDVPLLLCRKLGPFLHSTVRSVQSFVRRQKPFLNDSDSNTKVESPDSSTIFDLQGFLLPCAVRDLVCATVNVLLGNEEASRQVEDDASMSEREGDNDRVGSHHFALRPTAYDGEEAVGNNVPGTIGSQSSKGMNGDYSLLQQHWDDTLTTTTQYCRHDELVQLAVWDVQRSKSLAYKLEHVSANLFPSK